MEGKFILKKMAPYKQGMQTEEVKKQFSLTNIVKLASNENPYGFSPLVKNIMQNLDWEIYPDGHASRLRTSLANKWDIGEDNLIFGSGSDELIEIICRTFLYDGVNTVMAAPTFSQYKHHALIEGATVKEIPTINGHHDLDGMLNAIDKNTKVVWICSPDNPTGVYISPPSFHSFMEQCPDDVLVVLDEAYFEFVDPSLQMSAKDNISRYPNLVVLRTFSKAYGLAGLRIGFGIMNKAISNKMNTVRGPFNTTSIAQEAARISLEDDSFIEKTCRLNKEVKKAFEQFLDQIGWNYFESQTNFLLIETPNDADHLTNYLLRNGFIVRSGNLLGYPKTIRVTIGKKDDMKQLQQLLTQYINEEG